MTDLNCRRSFRVASSSKLNLTGNDGLAEFVLSAVLAIVSTTSFGIRKPKAIAESIGYAKSQVPSLVSCSS
jgi:hypothetical protein